MATGRKRGGQVLETSRKVTRRVMVNLTDGDYATLMAQFDPNVYASQAEYWRDRLVNGRVVQVQRDSSVDRLSDVLAGHNDEIHKTSVNLNQLVRYLNTHKVAVTEKQFGQLLEVIRKLLGEQLAMKDVMHQLSQRWLR